MIRNADGWGVKLRLFKESIRIRVRRSDLEELLSTGLSVQAVQSGALMSQRIEYGIGVSETEEWSVDGAMGGVIVRIPVLKVRQWAESDQVGLEYLTGWGVRILIEKDFSCLEIRNGESDEGTFPRPEASQTRG